MSFYPQLLSRKIQKSLFSSKFQRIVSAKMNFSQARKSYETIIIHEPYNYVKHVEINRPDKRNAMNKVFFDEFLECFENLSVDPDCRVVVLSGAGKTFSSGIDLQLLMDFNSLSTSDDPARKAYSLFAPIKKIQNAMSVVENCQKPVIVAIHNSCIGAGVDLMSACDIRYCTNDSVFQIKEVEMGLAADVGTLQRLPKIMNNQSLVRELVYTARKFLAKEAMEHGLVSKIFNNKNDMITEAINTAKIISELSPVAVQTSKKSLNYSRDHSVQEGLDHILHLNSVMLQSEDTVKSVVAAMSKEKAVFSKL